MSEEKFYLTKDQALLNKLKLGPDPKANTGQIACVDTDGIVYLDWGKIESCALRGDMLGGPMIDKTMWAFATALLAVRDKTWKPLES